MEQSRALVIGAAVGAAVLGVLIVGQVMRWFTRFLTWGLFVLLAVALAYVAYRLAVGWNQAGAEAAARSESEESARADTEEEATLTDEEFEEEVELLLEEG